MDLQTKKLDLIKWITEVNEPSVIQKIIELKQEQQSDWWDTISEDERLEIEEGLRQADNGEVFTHDEVMAEYKKWLSK